jgi:hypothetical protein
MPSPCTIQVTKAARTTSIPPFPAHGNNHQHKITIVVAVPKAKPSPANSMPRPSISIAVAAKQTTGQREIQRRERKKN